MHLQKQLEKRKISSLPTLKQIQNYLYHQRKARGDSNKLEDIQSHVNSRSYETRASNTDMFFFGADFGDGSDSDHFHLGFTSVALLKSCIENQHSKLFHLDATYKVLKYFYPLIVFGYTDADHKFYPACYMITSHEETRDNTHFFKQLNNVIKGHFGVGFEPTFIMSDAGKSIGSAIRKTFPNCTKLMCFFHVMYNVCIFHA